MRKDSRQAGVSHLTMAVPEAEGGFSSALILKSSRQAASRRMLQEVPETAGASSQTPFISE
jgi:hypothetical protein